MKFTTKDRPSKNIKIDLARISIKRTSKKRFILPCTCAKEIPYNTYSKKYYAHAPNYTL